MFLNELRHRKNTALTLRFPISRKDLPSVMAVKGKTGIVEGIDYRGVPVLATLRKIPDSPWYLVSKIDVDEANALIKRRTQFVAIIVALLIAFSGAGFGFLWRHQSARFYKKQYETEIERAAEHKRAEEALHESEKRLIEAQKMAHLGYWIWDVRTGNVEWSEEVFNIFHLDPKEFTPQIDSSIHALSPWPEDHERDKELIRKAMETHEMGTFEQRFHRPDKSIGYYHSTFQGKYDDGGNLIFIVGTVQDITDRKQMEEALKDSEERWKFALEGAGDGVWDWNARTNEVIYSRQWKAMLGFEEHEIGTTLEEWDRRIHPEDKERVYAELDRHFSGRVPVYVSEHRVQCKDGTYKWILDRGKVVSWAEDGKPLRVVGTHTDLTERKQAEEALRRSEERFKQVANSIGEWVWEVDVDGLYTYSSPGLEKIVGYKPEEVVGKMHFYDLFIPEKKEELKKAAFEVFAMKESFKGFVNPNLHKNGTLVILETSGAPILDEQGRLLGYCGGDTDITERKRAEEALKESERKFRAIFDSTSDGMFLLDLETKKFVMCNEMCSKMLGFTQEEFLNLGIADIHPSEDLPFIFKHIGKVLEGNPGVRADIRFRRKDGTVFFTDLSPSLMTADERKFALVVFKDITDRKQAEAILRESEERFRVVFERAGVGIALVDSTGYTLKSNPAIQNMLGYSADELAKMHFTEFVHPEDAEEELNLFMELIAGKRDTFRREERLIAKDGRVVWIDLTVTSQRRPEGDLERVIVMIIDITERKQAEEQMLSLQAQLQQSQKMEAIGQLAGGVAHDFNNLLTVISVQAQLALRVLREGDPLKEKLKDIELSADRAGNLTRQLLAFSRRQILEMKVINLNFILKDMEKMLRRVIGEDIELKAVLSDDLGMVKVDPGQMEQVIVNLAVNAKDAMPQGGKLFLETANAELDEEYVRSHVGMIPGAYIILSITDTGIGMSKEVKEQIFDPFFTTKEKGKGTGLGLSTVYGIVKQSGGDIYVYSEPNKGTTFKVYLPRVFEPPEELKKEAREELPRGKETILVVEDDRMVRRLAVDILRRQGYRVLEADEGGEALVICEKEKDPIDLILTDIVMPHIGGPELIERLKQVRKDFKVLYMTGYTDESIVQHGILEEGIELIHKPFTIEKLVRKVREVLDS